MCAQLISATLSGAAGCGSAGVVAGSVGAGSACDAPSGAGLSARRSPRRVRRRPRPRAPGAPPASAVATRRLRGAGSGIWDVGEEAVAAALPGRRRRRRRAGSPALSYCRRPPSPRRRRCSGSACRRAPEPAAVAEGARAVGEHHVSGADGGIGGGDGLLGEDLRPRAGHPHRLVDVVDQLIHHDPAELLIGVPGAAGGEPVRSKRSTRGFDAPVSIARFAAAYWGKRTVAGKSHRPRARACSTSSCASGVRASGFSHTTSLPASSAARTIWMRGVGVQTSTSTAASGSSSAVRGGPRFSEPPAPARAVAVQLRVELDPARQVGAGDPAGADDADAEGCGWGGRGHRRPFARADESLVRTSPEWGPGPLHRWSAGVPAGGAGDAPDYASAFHKSSGVHRRCQAFAHNTRATAHRLGPAGSTLDTHSP